MWLRGGFSWKRILKILLASFGVLAIFYLWQPYRVQWVDKTPCQPLPVVPIEQTGLFEKGRRVLIVTAHPDDDAYYIAGTLYLLKDSQAIMGLVVCTNGDNGYYPWSNTQGLSRIRQEEERKCAHKVGIKDVKFLNEPDGRMSVDEGLINRIASQISQFQPQTILTFDPQFPYRVAHRDHLGAGKATLLAAKRASYSGELLLFATVSPNTYTDITLRWTHVEDLLATHASQFHDERLKRIEASVLSYAQIAGERFGPGLAEAFRACRLQ